MRTQVRALDGNVGEGTRSYVGAHSSFLPMPTTVSIHGVHAPESLICDVAGLASFQGDILYGAVAIFMKLRINPMILPHVGMIQEISDVLRRRLMNQIPTMTGEIGLCLSPVRKRIENKAGKRMQLML